MKIILIAGFWLTFLLGGLLQASEGQPYKQSVGDLEPWPLGVIDCPFQLEDAEGLWKYKAERGSYMYIEFIVHEHSEEGLRSFEINQYDKDMILYATGVGLSQHDTKAVSAGMRTVSPAEPYREYFAFVRSYIKKQKKSNKKSCENSNPVKVLTLRPANGNEKKVDYQLKPIKEAERCRIFGGMGCPGK